MPSRSELAQVRSALSKLSADAGRGFRKTWESSLGAADRAVMSGALQDGWLAFVEHYGDLSASVGAEMFEKWAGDLALPKPRTKLAPGMNERQAMANLGNAIASPDQLGMALTALDRLVKQPYRDTLQQSAWASGAAWARVPDGPSPCAFCLMVASRGAVYSSEGTAGGAGNEYHGKCNCTPTLVMGEEDFPEGYDPAALYDQYDSAAAASVGKDRLGVKSTKAILAEMRQQSGSR